MLTKQHKISIGAQNLLHIQDCLVLGEDPYSRRQIHSI